MMAIVSRSAVNAADEISAKVAQTTILALFVITIPQYNESDSNQNCWIPGSCSPDCTNFWPADAG
jgi:hypothetical protein